MIKRYFVVVEGIVQGVGFRPFVYNLALELGIKGWVNNNSEGVYIDIEGQEEQIKSFLNSLEFNAPPLSRIENIKIEERKIEDFEDFTIKESVRDDSKITLISPDIATCSDCLEDIRNPHNRRYKYPFTNCTNCGPRFSIIKTIPYDRDKTTMKKFEMCSYCNSEYTNPLDRRFHAQPNACDSCGPHLLIADRQGRIIEKQELEAAMNANKCSNNEFFNETDLVIKWTQSKLKDGAIFAIKGLTGFNLVCDATNSNSVSLMRKRKYRPHKPFAVMMKDIKTAREYCSVNSEEVKLLSGIRKPIVLLNKNNSYNLPDGVAPNQSSLGVMLPYTPMHELLLSDTETPVLIMTSANIHGLPLEHINRTAIDHLHDIVDYFLLHDRDIHLPVDDSVSKVVLGKERIIRRARGYAPEPVRMKGVKSILACGSNMKNTFCIAKDDFLFLSQHNGDLENIETFEHYKRNIEHFKNIFIFEPEYLAADLHPEYESTKFALHSELPVIQVQHHHAHIVSCMAENKVEHEVIGLSFDGTGYGTDGKVWGGEFLVCDYKSFTRAGHLDYTKMPGGEKAIMEPWRMAVSHLYKTKAFSREEISSIFGKEALPIINMMERNINSIETSSMGRLFDAVSAIIGVCRKVSYEGQASMELEALIRDENAPSEQGELVEKDADLNDSYHFSIFKSDEVFILNTDDTIKEIYSDKLSGININSISRKFHNTIIKASVDLCKLIRDSHRLNEVALSGGVFQNSYLLKHMILTLQKEGFKVYSHSSIPSNDGGISLGQIIAANEIIKERQEK